MRSKTNFWKRSMAALLSFVMVLAMVPAFALTADAATKEHNTDIQGDTYISLPITIRDFPADGMLFENNEYGNTGTVSLSGGTTMSVNTTSWDTSGGTVIVYTANNTLPSTNKWQALGTPNEWWLSIYVKADGSVDRVYKSGATTRNTTIPSGGMVIVAHSNCTAYYNTLNTVTEANKGNYRFTLNGSTLSMTQGSQLAGTFHYGNTAGYGMLNTNDANSSSVALDKGNVTSGTYYKDAIPGTTLLMNGTWASTSDPSPLDLSLNSGASHQLYGGWIRTNLVQPKLDSNKNLVYTQATVDFLVSYMETTLTTPWQNTNDGSYNLGFVMGDKLFDNNNKFVGKGNANATRDLAAVLRSQITGRGSYSEAQSDFTSGKLATVQDINSYYDAAYFLLHTTFDDVQGYGLSVPAYDEVRLVKKTKADGKVYYTFNSAFDNTNYNYTDGYIINSQTTYVTDRQGMAASLEFTRGNIQALNRFDPLGPSGAGKEFGYGMSGSIYKDYYTALGASDATKDDTDKYYENTNYNLSLEGHAQFIYYEDDELYFTFTGDDDVYLFINGVRVLDLGGAHSISKATIKLNDVASLCGLRDGQSYDFDFYYMERHGTAANFGIETNIKIVDPAMLTEKTGYQNGVSTGYNGFVDPTKKVGYSFELQNNGDADLTNLTFDDSDIGVKFTKDSITLNNDSNINEMYAILYGADGAIKTYIKAGELTETTLKSMLATGIAVGEKIGIYGFKYMIPTDKWVNNTFTNTVHTTGLADANNVGERTLNGIAEWKVQKKALVTDPFHVYDWVTKDVSKNSATVCDWTLPAEASVTVTKAELVQPVKDKGMSVPDGVTIALCTASGNESGVNINPNATLNSDGSITYKSTKPGQDTVYYKIKGISGTTYDNVVFSYNVYTYGTVNNVYVLDYGLAVELNGDGFGLRVNDYLTVAQNPNATTETVTGVQDATSNYGTFTWDNPFLKYAPTDIIDNIDSVRANIQVLEDDATELTKFTGVNMYETVTTAPANVVYYEENFPGITYVNTDENNWAHYETVNDEGNSVAGTEQSADQDSNYGSDPNYEEDKVGTIVSGDNVGTVVSSTTFNLDTSDLDALQASGIEALNKYLGLGGSDSNGTVNELVVNETSEVMYFEFVGTGFEIISRTTAEQYAVINVQVQKDNGDGTYTVVTQKPVITESKGGDLYQVPIISITGLVKDEYRVVVKAAGSTDTKTRVLYIDGIRIYGPLDNDQALEYYNPEEYQAKFLEVKQMIENGQMIYADASDTDGDTQFVTGTTLIEDVEQTALLTAIESADDYMKVGPNNEIYLDGTSSTGVIVFFLTPTENYPESARTLEIGAHRKTESNEDSNGAVYMSYGSTAQDILEGTYSYDIASGTEMYYTIDVNNLELKDGKYLVMIGTNGADFLEALALTTLKVAGYEITFAETAVQASYDAGTLKQNPLYAEPYAVLSARMAAQEPEVEEPEVEQIPVNENLSITAASLRADKVVSGKTAILTVKASCDAASIVITDADGNAVEATKCTTKASGGVVTFTFTWKVTGSRGDALDYSIRVYDANGLASVNTEIVTVTIK